MRLFHGSDSAELNQILATGLFGGIFASHSSSVAEAHNSHLYVVEPARPLTNYELNYEIHGAFEAAMKICGNDETKADAIMTAGCVSDDTDPESGWDLQRLRGELALALGYDAVEMEDEHGTTWLCLPGCAIKKWCDE